MRSRFSVAAVALLALGALTVQASARPDVRRMTCPEAQRFVQQNSPVVVTTGRYTYDQLLGSSGSCLTPYVAQATYVTTRDGVECPVGFTCVTGGDFMFSN